MCNMHSCDYHRNSKSDAQQLVDCEGIMRDLMTKPNEYHQNRTFDPSNTCDCRQHEVVCVAGIPATLIERASRMHQNPVVMCKSCLAACRVLGVIMRTASAILEELETFTRSTSRVKPIPRDCRQNSKPDARKSCDCNHMLHAPCSASVKPS